VLQCVAVCCSVLQCVAVCCSMLQETPFLYFTSMIWPSLKSATHFNTLQNWCNTLQIPVHDDKTAYLSVLQCVSVRCSVLQHVAVCCSVLQCVAVCCSVLQCVIVFAGNTTCMPQINDMIEQHS